MDAPWRGWLPAGMSEAGWWALGAALVLAWLAWRWRRWRRSRRAKSTTRRAVRAEGDAVALLVDHGYAVEAVQPRLRWSVAVDGVPTPIELRADFLVRRGRGRYVADVKTGRTAPQVTHSPTRRQLLEYRVAYGVDGVLLVDMEASEIRTVDFDVNQVGTLL